MSLPLSTRAVGLEESVESIVNRINRRGLRLKVNANEFTQPLGRITDKANEFTKSLEASNARVIAFGASAAIIGGVGKVFEQLVVQAVKFEKIMTDINVVLDTSARNLEKFGQQLFGVAKNTSQALDVAAEAALEFSRQGLSMEETLKRTNDALILTRLTGMKAADAVKSLTAAVNGFADAGITTTQIINKMSAVDVKFAVSADDLANALARAGAVAQDAGVNFDQLIAAVTSAQQITARGGNVIGNSFKTIFTRIQRSSTLNQLQKLGIVVRDLRGNTLGAMKVLSNLAQTYDTLTASQQASTAEAVGGVFQINILKAGMKDLAKTNSLYSQALKVSSLATDQAYKKNEKLQTTMASLATQTSLSIQELSKNIGDLALAPGISGILEAVNSAVEGLNSLLGKDSDGLGADMAKGFVSGFGKVLMGPGMVLALGIFGKLFFSAFKFAKQSLKDVLGVVTVKDRELKIQNAIVEAMQNNKHLASELTKYAGDKLKQETIILQVIEDQTKFLEKQRAIASGLAPGLAKKGVTGSLTLPSGSSSTSTTASGHIPNFAKSPSPMDRVREKNAAKKGGYAAGNVRAMDMPGVGRVIYNSAEEVREIPGSRQPAIIPPSGSRAGREYKRNFQGKLGFNPYDNNSQGFIPNYAKESNGLLTLRPAFATVAGGPNFRNQALDQSFRNAISSGKPMFIKGSTTKIAGLRGSHNARIHDVLKGLEKRGINEIGRPFYVANKGRTARMKQLPGEKDSDFQERVKLKGVRKTHKGYFSTGGSDGDDSFPTDIIGKGLKPIEVKAGEIDKHNLLLKSFRLYSDSELLHYANQFPELKAKVSMANQAHRSKGERLLNKKGILNADSALEETEEELISHSVAGGFIPNFADGRNRQQKIQDVLGDPANKNVKFKGGGLGHKTIKSKHFSQKSWLESYFKKGLGTDYEMLLDMGYDPTNLKKLRAHAKTGGQVNVLGKGFVPNFNKLANFEKGRKYENRVGSVFHRPPGRTSRMDWYPANAPQTSKVEPHNIGAGSSQINRESLNSKFIDAHTGRGGGKNPGHSAAELKGKIMAVYPKIDEAAVGRAALSGKPYLFSDFTEITEAGKNVDRKLVTKESQGFKFSFFQDQFNPRKGKTLPKKPPETDKTHYIQGLSSGFVPNFANPLEAAINRESAAGIPKSMMRLDQDSSLASRVNPLGLAVTNTRDEPSGVKQGIRRAKMQGTDPKTHGIPNYAVPTIGPGPALPMPGGPSVVPAVNESLRGFAGVIEKSAGMMEGLDMKLMGLTTATYFLEGAFQDAESGIGLVVKNIAAGIQGLSQGAMLGSMGAQVSTNFNKTTAEQLKAGKIGKGSGFKGNVVGGARALGGAFMNLLGPIGLILGVMPPLIKYFGLFETASDKAAKKLNKVTDNLAALDTVIDLSKKSQEDTVSIRRLESLGGRRSIEQSEKLLAHQTERSVRSIKLNAGIAKLSSRFGDSSDIQNNLNGTYKERIKYLNELKQAELKNANLVQNEKDFANAGILESGPMGIGKQRKVGVEGLEQEKVELAQKQFAARVMAHVKILENMDPAAGDAAWKETVIPDSMVEKTEWRKHPNVQGFALPRGKMETYRERQFKGADKYVNQLLAGMAGQGMITSDDQEAMSISMRSAIRTTNDSVSGGAADRNAEEEAWAVHSLLERFREVARGKIIASEGPGKDATSAAQKQEEIQISALQEGQKLMRETNKGITEYHLIQDQKLALARKDIRLIESGLKLRAKLNESMGAIGGDDLVTANRDQAIGSTNRTARLDTQNEDRALQKLQDNRIQKAMLDKDKNPLITGNEAVFDANLGMKKHVPTALIQTSDSMMKSGIDQNAASAGSGDDQKAAAEAFAKYAISLKDRAAASDEILTREETYALAQKQIFNLKKTEQKNAFLRGMKESGLLSIQDDNMTLLTEDLKNSEGISIIKKDGIEQQRKKSNRQHNINAADESLSKKTLSAGQSRLNLLLYDNDTQKNVGKTLIDGLRSSATWAKGNAARNKLQLAALMTDEGQIALQLKSMGLADEKVVADEILLKTKVSEAQEEVARLAGSKELTELASDQHDLLIAQLDKDGLILTEKGKLYENYQKLREAVVKQVDNETKKADQGRDKERVTHGYKMETGEYQKEKGRAMEQNIETLEGTQEALKYSVALHKSNGNTAKAAEATLALANNIKSLNEELNQGSMFWDSIRVKIAEADNRAARFAETLANTSFDAVRDGFSTMFSDLSSGTKKTSMIMLEFAGSIAKKIQDKLFDYAADRITSGIFKLFGMDKFHSGGFVSHYAGGGETKEVPAMLTAGEYVVRKKVVDRIGIKALDEMNEKGSLEELFDQPNQDKFDLFSEGGQASSQPFAGQEYNAGGLSNLLKLNGGGLSDSEKAVGDIMYGAGAMGGAALAGYMNREPDNNDDAPVAPDTRRVNTTSSLDLGFKDPRLSAKYRQDDQNSQDYGKYLLDKYQYDVDKKNASEEEKAALIRTIGMTVGLGVGMAIGNKIGKGVANSIVGAKLSGNGIKTTDGQRITYDSQTNQFNTVAKDGTKSSTEYTSTLTDRFRGYASPNSELGNDSKSAAIFMREQGYLVGRDGNPSFGGLTEGARGTGKPAGTKMSPNCAGGVCSAEPQSSNHSNSGGRHPPQRPYDALTDRANALSTRFNDINKKYDEKNAGGIVSNSSNVNNYNSGGKVGLKKAYGNMVSAKSNIERHKNKWSPAKFQKNKTEYNQRVMDSKKSNAGYFQSLDKLNRGGIASNVNNYNSGGSIFNTNDMRKKAESSSSTNDYSSINSVSNSSNNNSIHRPSRFEEKNMGGIIGGQMHRFASGGSVSGPAGIDKVGPVMLDNGEYVIKSNSVRNIEQSYPGLLDKLNSSNFNEGGQVGSSPASEPQSNNVTTNNETSNESSSNVTVNINVGSNGSSSTEVSGGGGSDNGQMLGSKLKEAVLSVMSQEMRVGGMLRGN